MSASRLVEFLRADFVKMSCGAVVLDMSNTLSVSPALARIGPVEKRGIEAYLSYWKKIERII